MVYNLCLLCHPPRNPRAGTLISYRGLLHRYHCLHLLIIPGALSLLFKFFLLLLSVIITTVTLLCPALVFRDFFTLFLALSLEHP